jgi:hypothetical protein
MAECPPGLPLLGAGLTGGVAAGLVGLAVGDGDIAVACAGVAEVEAWAARQVAVSGRAHPAVARTPASVTATIDTSLLRTQAW